MCRSLLGSLAMTYPAERQLAKAKRPLVFLSLVVWLTAASAPADAYPRPGRTSLLSIPTSPPLDGQTGEPSISGDGRFVAFSSWATNLVTGDTNDRQDIFVRDRMSGTLELVSAASDGTQADAESYDPHLSADGRFVVFESDATTLVAADTNGARDIFVHDRAAGTTERVSVATGGGQAANSSNRPAISADGRFVAFDSQAENLVPTDANGLTDIFVRNRVEGTTERISVAADGTEGDGSSFWADLSADGGLVAFQSSSLNLVPGPPASPLSSGQIFVKDRTTGSLSLVSTSSEGGRANGPALVPHISADGGHLVFTSTATNLSAWDLNGDDDAFVKDLETGDLERITIASTAVANDGGAAYGPAISADGRFVAFASGGTNLVPGDTNTAPDIFVRDLAAGITERVSVSSGGAQGPGSSAVPDISDDGRFVSFWTNSVLEDGDSVPYYDVYVRDRGPVVGPGEVWVASMPGAVHVSGWARFGPTVLSSGTDSPADGLGPAAAVGAELTSAAVTYRPEEEDLLVRLDVTGLPGQRPPDLPPGFAVAARGGVPAVLYGLELSVAGVEHQVRASRIGRDASANPPPTFALYRCDPGCTEVQRLAGGLGTTGNAVQVSVPLEVLGLSGGADLGDLRAFTAMGEIDAGPVAELDSLSLGSAAVPAFGVSLGMTPEGIPEEQVEYSGEAGVAAGSFEGTIETTGLPAGSYDVWTRACVGEVCMAGSSPLALG